MSNANKSRARLRAFMKDLVDYITTHQKTSGPVSGVTIINSIEQHLAADEDTYGPVTTTDDGPWDARSSMLAQKDELIAELRLNYRSIDEISHKVNRENKVLREATVSQREKIQALETKLREFDIALQTERAGHRKTERLLNEQLGKNEILTEERDRLRDATIVADRKISRVMAHVIRPDFTKPPILADVIMEKYQKIQNIFYPHDDPTIVADRNIFCPPEGDSPGEITYHVEFDFKPGAEPEKFIRSMHDAMSRWAKP
jgi:hypothetical protein